MTGTNAIAVTATDPTGNVATNQCEVDSTGASRTFTYDANGNLTGDGSRTFEWDSQNQLIAISVRKNLYSDSEPAQGNNPSGDGEVAAHDGLPNRLLTAFEVAEFVRCHEETVRRAYAKGLLVSQRFGVRGRRFHPRDVSDWMSRGLPTKVS